MHQTARPLPWVCATVVKLLRSWFNLALNVTMMCCSIVIEIRWQRFSAAQCLKGATKQQHLRRKQHDWSLSVTTVLALHFILSPDWLRAGTTLKQFDETDWLSSLLLLLLEQLGATALWLTSVLRWCSEVVVREQVLPSTSCVIWRFHIIKVSRKFQSLMTELLLMCFLTGKARLQVNAAEKSVLLLMEEMRMIWEDKCEHLKKKIIVFSINILNVGDMMHKIQEWKLGNMEFC